MPETTGASAATAASSFSSAFWSEIESLKTPAAKNVAQVPAVGSRAPSCPELELPNKRPTVILFLRHCGCPFAEKTFKALTALSSKHKDVCFIAVSHSSADTTERWIPQVGGAWDAQVIMDPERDLYARWGLGLSTAWQMANPFTLYSALRLGTDEGIWNLPTESGTRWQKSGAFAVDCDGIVRWTFVAGTADAMPDLSAGLVALGIDVA